MDVQCASPDGWGPSANPLGTLQDPFYDPAFLSSYPPTMAKEPCGRDGPAQIGDPAPASGNFCRDTGQPMQGITGPQQPNSLQAPLGRQGLHQAELEGVLSEVWQWGQASFGL